MAKPPRLTLLDSRALSAPHMLRALPRPRLRHTMLFIVMVALLLAQTLGLMHRLVHAPHAAQAAFGVDTTPQASAVQGPQAHVEGATHAASTWLDRLFAAHADTGCEAYDQLAHSDFLWSDAPTVSEPAVHGATPSSHPVWQLAAQAAGYLARGPPTQV